jgi:hypothetical protein
MDVEHAARKPRRLTVPWPRGSGVHPCRVTISSTHYQSGGSSLGPTERSEGGSGCRCGDLVKRLRARLHGPCRWTTRHGYKGRRDNPHTPTSGSSISGLENNGSARFPWSQGSQGSRSLHCLTHPCPLMGTVQNAPVGPSLLADSHLSRLFVDDPRLCSQTTGSYRRRSLAIALVFSPLMLRPEVPVAPKGSSTRGAVAGSA